MNEVKTKNVTVQYTKSKCIKVTIKYEYFENASVLETTTMTKFDLWKSNYFLLNSMKQIFKSLEVTSLYSVVLVLDVKQLDKVYANKDGFVKWLKNIYCQCDMDIEEVECYDIDVDSIIKEIQNSQFKCCQN